MYFSCSTTGSISFFHERRRRQIGLKICYPSFVWRFTSEAKVKSVLFVNLHRSSSCTQKVKDQPRLFVLYSSIIWLLFHFSSLLTSYLRDSSSYVLSFVSELKKKRQCLYRSKLGNLFSSKTIAGADFVTPEEK